MFEPRTRLPPLDPTPLDPTPRARADSTPPTLDIAGPVPVMGTVAPNGTRARVTFPALAPDDNILPGNVRFFGLVTGFESCILAAFRRAGRAESLSPVAAPPPTPEHTMPPPTLPHIPFPSLKVTVACKASLSRDAPAEPVASGATEFPWGVTSVTCVATDAAGLVSKAVSFPVWVECSSGYSWRDGQCKSEEGTGGGGRCWKAWRAMDEAARPRQRPFA
jgi:hypothetical protein